MIDLTQILQNVASSMISVEKMLTAIIYVMGVGLIISAIKELKVTGGSHSDAEEKTKTFLKLMVGAFFVYLPTTFQVFSETFFGQGSVVSFDNYSPISVYSSMKIIIQAAGIIWFARGSMMLYDFDNPSHKEKSYMSFTYIFAGILAINLDASVGSLNYLVGYIIQRL